MSAFGVPPSAPPATQARASQALTVPERAPGLQAMSAHGAASQALPSRDVVSQLEPLSPGVVSPPAMSHQTDATLVGGGFALGGAPQAFAGPPALPPRRGTARGGAQAALAGFPEAERNGAADAAVPSPTNSGATAHDFGYPASPPQVAAFPASGAEAVNGDAEIEPEWTQVYHDFVRIKQDCGEAVDGFTFERFTATLRKNRDTLMRQHGVQHVQFSAYVKQGRAALKAKPVR
jgi:hypothetical protein